MSSNSRTFSRATLRLAASVDRSLTSALGEGVLAIEVLKGDNAGRLSADADKRPEQ